MGKVTRGQGVDSNRSGWRVAAPGYRWQDLNLNLNLNLHLHLYLNTRTRSPTAGTRDLKFIPATRLLRLPPATRE